MPYAFTLHRESIKRKFAVYVVIARASVNTKFYVGKTGDNNDGCNPLISRCGNHFSYNDVHSQVRNKLDDHEGREYTYIFEHFDDYTEDKEARRTCIDRINEMERWLNQVMQQLVASRPDLSLLNEYRGVGHVSARERAKREAFRTPEAKAKLTSLIAAVRKRCG